MSGTSKIAYARDIAELTTEQGVDPQQGLSTTEVENRRARYGLNEIPEEARSPAILIFIRQFNSLMVYLLLVAVGVSFYFGEYADAYAILAVIVLNSCIGFWLEWQAQRSMNALRSMTRVPARVVRDGSVQAVDSTELVPGDIILAEAGDMIAADARVLEANRASTDESPLTGESLPVEKHTQTLSPETMLAERSNMVYKGTILRNGNIKALVIATGTHTEIGRIAHLVSTAGVSATPLEKKLNVFSKRLIWITLALVGLIAVAGLLSGVEPLSLLKTSIALAVAAIPEGLPIVSTLALARGMLRMSKKKVLVKKLSAVETLGGTSVICTDKTGTLTKNKIEVKDIFPADNSPDARERLLEIAVLCNTAEIEKKGKSLNELGDPLETGLLRFACDQKIDYNQLRRQAPKIAEEPFSSETRMMATLHQFEGRRMIYAKGAAEDIIQKCTSIHGAESFSSDLKQQWNEKAAELASKGLRIIAGAYRVAPEGEVSELTENLIFAGLYGMADPPAEGVYEAIEECRKAGIRVIMITGDHPSTAKSIAEQLKLSLKPNLLVLSGGNLDAAPKDDKARKLWREAEVFARVSPEQKLSLISVLQEDGEIVGMTGDGVNDAPALKKADIGIAMGIRGTQAAQEAAVMILKDDSFRSIVSAVRQGRIIYENIRKFVVFLLSCNMSELFLVSAVALAGMSFQLLPLQILFINLITDVLPALALGVSGGNPGIMRKPPRNPDEALISRRQWYDVVIYAIVISAWCGIAVFASSRILSPDNALNNNVLFFTLIVCQLFHVFNMGAGATFSVKYNEVLRNKYVWYSMLVCAGVILAILFVPLFNEVLAVAHMPALAWFIILFSGFGCLATNSSIKWSRSGKSAKMKS